MIVDVHYHLIPALSEERVGGLVEFLIRSARFMGKAIDKKILTKKLLETVPDPTGERLIAWMEESGVDFTCICANDPGSEMLSSKLAQKANRIVGDIAQKYPDRVLALAGINPTRPEAPDMLKQCFEEFGVRGLNTTPIMATTLLDLSRTSCWRSCKKTPEFY